MQFIKPGINIDFIGKKRYAFILSAVLLLVSLGFVLRGLNFGIDFAGGTIIQVKFDTATPVDAIRDGLETIGMGGATVQLFGNPEENEYMIRSEAGISEEGAISEKVTTALTDSTGSAPTIRRVEMVGPQVGKDLREKALFAMFYALLFITIYISGRFELQWFKSGVMAGGLILVVWLLSRFVSIPWLIVSALVVTLILFWALRLRYAMGAIAALIHDVSITVGIFALFGKEFSLPIVAALLTIIGYSLNDTIIVFDRIRENLRKFYKNPMKVTINKSINETLNRTILTSLTTLVVVGTLFVMGGGIIHDFAFALIVGVLVGTYSSIYVASPILLAWEELSRRR
jgi:preprotein translocase subunit SecF